MSADLVKTHRRTIDDAVSRLLSRAGESYGLDAGDLRERVEHSLEKYLFGRTPAADARDVAAFVDEIHADEMCLVLACERGVEKAWEDLVARYDSTVRSAARKICSNSEDADDLAGSIWAELHGLRTDADGKSKSKLAYYSGRGSLGGWLRAIVSQLGIDEYRKQSRLVQIEEPREFENLAEESAHQNGNQGIVHHADSPEQALTDKRTAADVTAALRDSIASLEAEDRLVLKLYYFDELKLKEIGAMFGYHEATASRRLVRIQNEIRKRVEKSLRSQHGWSDVEVKKYLADAATSLGVGIEKMFAVLVAAAVVQDALTRAF
ncbi:MAG: sigma-70 family RNA polymerase sigma factor [Pyrinomonadaceae bacterium]